VGVEKEKERGCRVLRKSKGGRKMKEVKQN
jgi:hypothetical protein